MMLDAPHEDGRVTGRMEIGLGPITASFAGEGTVSSFPAEYRQVITGRGADRKSGSNASGEVAYRLHEMAGPTGEKVTRVDVEMSYALTGPLAQFGRSNLVRDLVSRVGESFAQNLDARLSAPEGVEIAPCKIGRRVPRLAPHPGARPRRRDEALRQAIVMLLYGRFLDPHPAAPWRVASFPSAGPAADLP